MMFSEDSSSANFYSVPGGSVDASSVWKPHPSHTDLNNHVCLNNEIVIPSLYICNYLE